MIVCVENHWIGAILVGSASGVSVLQIQSVSGVIIYANVCNTAEMDGKMSPSEVVKCKDLPFPQSN